jgi:hypothetical protein
VVRGFISIYPKQSVSARFVSLVFDNPTNRELTSHSATFFPECLAVPACAVAETVTVFYADFLFESDPSLDLARRIASMSFVLRSSEGRDASASLSLSQSPSRVMITSS